MTAQKQNCHVSMVAMASSSIVVEERVVIITMTNANIRDTMAGRGESVQIMIGVKSASSYRAQNGQSEDCPSILQGLYTDGLVCTCLGVRTIQDGN